MHSMRLAPHRKLERAIESAARFRLLGTARSGYEAGMPEAKVNWSTAEVKDAKLSVELEGETPSSWKESFKMTATLLDGGGDWGKVQLKKQTVRVADVSPGSEDELRHHLESLVEQANAAIRPPEAGSEREDGEGDGPDERMKERFRAFDKDRAAQPSAQ
jgi:hypothetical protein